MSLRIESHIMNLNAQAEYHENLAWELLIEEDPHLEAMPKQDIHGMYGLPPHIQPLVNQAKQYRRTAAYYRRTLEVYA